MQNISILLFTFLLVSNAFGRFQSLDLNRKMGNVNQSSQMAVGLKSKFGKVFSKHFDGKKLGVLIEWGNSRPNAYASFDDEGAPYVLLTEGMINHRMMNQDSVNLVICHELGHFLAGSPKKNRGRSQKKSWSSAEGQADYFATAYCMKALLSFESTPQKFASEGISKDINSDIDYLCGGTLRCKRIVEAAYRLARVYADSKFYPVSLSLVQRSDNVVSETLLSHPEPQCRLDTMVAGALCPYSLEMDFNKNTQLECDKSIHSRPPCWFARGN